MKKVIITSEKYAFCLPTLYKTYRKYWKNHGQFDVLGWNIEHIKMPKDFNYVPAPAGTTDGTDWADAIVDYISSIKEKFFFLSFEDHFLINDVCNKRLDRAVQIMEQDSSVKKIRLLREGIPDKHYCEDFSMVPKVPGTFEFCSLQPCLWDKEFFLKLLTCLRPTPTPGHFETRNLFTFFNENVLTPRDMPPVFPFADAFRHSKPTYDPNKKHFGPDDNTSFPGKKHSKGSLKEEDIHFFQEVAEYWWTRNG